MRRIPLALGLAVLISCSDPQGWTLWGHAYSVEDDENKLIGDDWESYDTYSSAGDCKSQIKSDLTSLLPQSKVSVLDGVWVPGPTGPGPGASGASGASGADVQPASSTSRTTAIRSISAG